LKPLNIQIDSRIVPFVTAPSTVVLLIVMVLAGCRGEISHQPPLWIKHGMEFQPKYKAFEENDYFADHRNMRTPPAGTVAQGLLKDDDAYWRGGDSAHPVAKNPVPLSMDLLSRGQERFDIYCSPCHGISGTGDGTVAKHGFVPAPPNLFQDRIVKLPDGQIYRDISFGIRSMPSYGKQIPEADRWAIVAYLRALQMSQNAPMSAVPDSEKANLR
jgi:mono/diheme cytochrome c family protein